MRRSSMKFGAKTSLYLVTSTGIAALAYQSSTVDPSSGFLNGFARSSRAVFTFSSCVVDYKYSLRGFPADSDEYRLSLSEIHLRSARRILRLCDTNKGFYVKAGQFVAAMRQVPKEYSSTLSSLQDQAVPCSFEAVKNVIRKSLGKDLTEIFVLFDEQPVAAASIAQVHRAVLKDHQEVAVKVQYPGLDLQMKYDLATMSFLSRSVAWFFPDYRFSWMVTEFEKSIASELNFIQEAQNSERAATNFKLNHTIRIPRIYWDFTSEKVLTMQFCEGKKTQAVQGCELFGYAVTGEPMYDQVASIDATGFWAQVYYFQVDDLEFFKEMGINPHEVAKALVEVFAEMIFVHGFLHGDPHPGNILVCPKGPNGFTLVILDHGIYKQLDEDFRRSYCSLWEALILLDSRRIQELGETFGVGKYAKYFPVIFTGRTINSKSALGRGMSLEEQKHMREDLKSLKMEDISSFMESLPPDFLTILRTDGLLRSLISKLGAPQRLRLLAYAKCALHGSSRVARSNSDSRRYLMSGVKTSFRYMQIRFLLEVMEFAAYVDDLRQLLNTRVIQYISSARTLLLKLGHLVMNVNLVTP